MIPIYDQISTILKDAKVLTVIVDAPSDREATDRALDYLGEVMDAYLRVQVPAYGAFAAQCDQIPDCGDAVANLRNDTLESVLKAIGAWPVFSGLIKAARFAAGLLPGQVVVAAGDVLSVVGSAVDTIDNAVSSLYNLDPSKMMGALEDGVALLASSAPFDITKDAVSLVQDMYDSVASIVPGLDEMPIISDVLDGVLDVLNITENVIYAIFGGLPDAAEAISEAFQDFGSFMVSNDNFVATGMQNINHAFQDANSAISDSIGKGGLSIASKIGHWIWG